MEPGVQGRGLGRTYTFGVASVYINNCVYVIYIYMIIKGETADKVLIPPTSEVSGMRSTSKNT